MKPYYEDDFATLYHGDCRNITAWLTADVLITDPPYGRAWRQGRLKNDHQADDSHRGIAGDADTDARDCALHLWGSRKAIIFGDLMLPPPAGVKQVLVYKKPPNAGVHGATAGRRRDLEAVYLLGPWQSGIGGASSILTTGARSQGNPSSAQSRYGHPHAKPLDLMAELVEMCPAGLIADPFAGGGSTLAAAKAIGRRAVGVEIEESYCERIAKRLSVLDLFTEGVT